MRAWGAAPVTPLERYAIESIVDYPVDTFRGRDEGVPRSIPTESLLRMVEGFARQVAADPILPKVLGGWSLEYTLSDAPLSDGLLSRAVDAVVEQIAPYTRTAHPRWWSMVMEPVAP